MCSDHHAAEGAYGTVVGGYGGECSNDYNALTNDQRWHLFALMSMMQEH